MNNLYKLFKIQCKDLLVLLEMESNGILFHTESALEYASKLQEQLDELLYKFQQILNSDLPCITSNDDISTVLYGGTIIETISIPIGHYKSGSKIGEVRYKKETIEHTFPQLVKPLKNTETKKSFKRMEDGSHDSHTQWEVNEPVLRKLKATGDARKVIDILLEYNKLDKLRGTYLQGYSDLITKMGWQHNMLHGSLNQCVAVTGRLSSNKPNLQNADKNTKKFMRTRYE